MNVIFEPLHKDVKQPVRSTEKAGAWDIFAYEMIQEEPDFIRYKTGFRLTPPDAYKLLILPRSSITKTKWVLQNSPGLGDEDFDGEYEVRFRAFPSRIRLDMNYWGYTADLVYPIPPYIVGERIAQICLSNVIYMDFINGTVQKTNRGGFGSTGNK